MGLCVIGVVVQLLSVPHLGESVRIAYRLQAPNRQCAGEGQAERAHSKH